MQKGLRPRRSVRTAMANEINMYGIVQKDAMGLDKAVEEARGKYRNYCTDFLVRKCTRSTCKYKHTVPEGFKSFLRKHGFDDLGPLAKGVEQE